MRIDLLIQAGTRLALWQWLDARGLGDVVQDTDPESPTFGEFSYNHTDPDSAFLWWRHPSGKMEATWDVDNTDPENPILTVTYYNGFYGMLRYRDVDSLEAGIGDWVANSTATSILEGFNGIGGEGITIVTPEDVNNHLADIGAPGHEWLGTGLWSDPRLWAYSTVMIGDERDFGDPPVTYRSLIDFNVWTPTTFPAGWELVEPEEPTVEAWVQGGGTGTAGSYILNALVTHDRPQDGGEIWVFSSSLAANTTEPSRDSTFDRWWLPISRLADYNP